MQRAVPRIALPMVACVIYRIRLCCRNDEHCYMSV